MIENKFPGERIMLITPSDPRWSSILQTTPHDIYHLSSYVRCEADYHKGEPCAVFVDAGTWNCIIPFIKYSCPYDSTYYDLISPYGYPGPLMYPEQFDRNAIQEAFQKILHVLREEKIVSCFIRLHPFLNQADVFKNAGTLVEHGPVIWIDLTWSDDELWRQLRPRYRSYIRHLQRRGVQAFFDDSFQYFDEFIEYYHRTMREVDAHSSYFFSPEYFYALKDALGSSLKLCVVRANSAIYALGLFSAYNGIIQYLFSGKQRSEHVRHATKLMMVYVRDWGHRNGYRIMHLGGGVGARRDTLYQFKRGFSKLEKMFYTFRVIVNEEKYAEFVHAWEKETGQKADPITGYFPAYRKPLE